MMRSLVVRLGDNVVSALQLEANALPGELGNGRAGFAGDLSRYLNKAFQE
jgi:hypothetical protein